MKISEKLRNGFVAAVRAPLVHFLVIGAAIYALYGLFGKEPAGEPDNTLRITVPEIAWLEESWQKRWNRAPTPAERQGLIQEYIRETVLYREALAMGLDKDDTIIRRRLAQKLEFLTQDLADLITPSDDDLKTYFAAHVDRYQAPDLFTFTHVFIDPDKRGDQTHRDAAEILAKLEALGEPAQGSDDFGDPFMLQRYYPERSRLEVSKLFGSEFAQSVSELSPGQWQGPLLSGYGVHLVYVHQRTEAEAPNFSDVRDRVAEDWGDDKRREINEQYYASLRERYNVVVEDGAEEQEVAALKEPVR